MFLLELGVLLARARVYPSRIHGGLTVFALRGRVQADEVASRLRGAGAPVPLRHPLVVVDPLEIEQGQAAVLGGLTAVPKAS